MGCSTSLRTVLIDNNVEVSNKTFEVEMEGQDGKAEELQRVETGCCRGDSY